jgi:hypothetical protein
MWDTIACSNFITDRITPSTDYLIGNTTYGWSNQLWDFNGSAIYAMGGAIPSHIAARYGMKNITQTSSYDSMDPSLLCEDVTRYAKLCATVYLDGGKISKSNYTGYLYLWQVDCLEGSDESGYNYLDMQSLAWTITAGDLATCVEWSVAVDRDMDGCDYWTLGFRRADKGEDEVVFGVTYRLDIQNGLEDNAFSPVCFAEGDEVEMFNGTKKAIELIKVGDKVKSIKNNKIVKGIVTDWLVHPTNKVVEVVKINGITAEPNHPIFIDGNWVAVKTLGTITTEFMGNWYNLEIDGNIEDSEHNYIIGGLTVSGLGDNAELNAKYQRQPKQLTEHLNVLNEKNI